MMAFKKFNLKYQNFFLQIPFIKPETSCITANTVVNSDKMSNIKNEMICLCGDNTYIQIFMEHCVELKTMFLGN